MEIKLEAGILPVRIGIPFTLRELAGPWSWMAIRYYWLTYDELKAPYYQALFARHFDPVELSDIAAMGGTPQHLLASLAIPRTGASRQVYQLYRGMMAACRPHHVGLIGGDTSASSRGWFLSLTLTGMVPPRQPSSGAARESEISST